MVNPLTRIFLSFGYFATVPNAHDFVLTCVEFNNDSIGATIHSQLYKKDSLDNYLFKDSNLTKTDPVTKQPIDLAKVVCLKYEDNQFKIDFQNKFTLKKNRHEDFGRNKSEIWQYIIGIHNHSNDYDEMGMV